jgi:uncharacterized protein (DUF1330 family)
VKSRYQLVFAVLAGAGIGALAARALGAEEAKTPPAYVIAEVEKDPTKTSDSPALRRYAEEAPKSIVPFTGRYVVRGGKVEALEGAAPKGYIVMIRFDSLEQARAWYDSPAYSAIRPIRQNAMKSRLLLVEGVAPQ